MNDFSLKDLTDYLNLYSILPRLVIQDSGVVLRESQKKKLLMREAMFVASSEWLAYLLQARSEPPLQLENERGIKAYAEQDRAWLDLLTQVRLRSEAQWMQQFGSALHLWFCTQFEREHTNLQQVGLLKPRTDAFPSKRAWAIAQHEELKFLIGDTSRSESALKLEWFLDEPISLSQAVSATIVELAEADLRFREIYYRPYLKIHSRCVSEAKACKRMQALYIDDKQRINFAAATNKRGPAIGFSR